MTPASALRFATWPLLYFGSLGLTAWLWHQGVDLGAAVVGLTVGLALTLFALERAWPLRPEWAPSDAQVGKDLLHASLGFALGSFTGAFLAQTAFEAVGARLSLWPAHWPVPLQVILAVCIFEWGAYWQHRWMHRFGWLFPFHAVHHNPRRLVLLKTTRNHAVDLGTASFLALTPLVLLGASGEVVLWVSLFSNVSALVQHANVPMPTPRWLDFVIATPRMHRSHHSRDLVEGNLNFAMNLMLFDVLFGTFRAPAHDMPPEVGMPADDGTASFLRQTFGPFGAR